MNGEYYQNPIFLNQNRNINQPNYYIEDILKNNKGKKINISILQPNTNEQEKIINGILQHIGKDFIIINNPIDTKEYLIPLIYIYYIKFDEKINI